MDINALIEDNCAVALDTQRELAEVVEAYPFFHAARLLYLSSLHAGHNRSFGDELQKGSFMLPSLSSLFHIVEGKNYELQPMSSTEGDTPIVTEDDDRTLSLIDQFLSDTDEASETVDDASTEATAPHSIPTVTEVTSDYASFLLQSDEVEEGEELKGSDLIDSFIRGQEGKSRYEMPEVEDGANDTVDRAVGEAETDVYNEKIVEILVGQRQYDKALEILREICLNNPEKNTKFATQIHLLETIVQSKDK